MAAIRRSSFLLNSPVISLRGTLWSSVHCAQNVPKLNATRSQPSFPSGRRNQEHLPWVPRFCQLCTESSAQSSNKHHQGAVAPYGSEDIELSNGPSSSSVNEQEVAKFDAAAVDWWNSKGSSRPLHSLGDIRAKYIGKCVSTLRQSSRLSHPLKDLKVLDIGCGGGILSERLARLGGHVTGLDASPKAIEVAVQHAQNQNFAPGSLSYLNSTLESIVDCGKTYDAVIASEVVEHVNDPKTFLINCCTVLKPGGQLFVSTMNRTPAAYLLAVVGAERVINLVPPGTHDWSKFLTPEEVVGTIEAENVLCEFVSGMMYNPLFDHWKLCSSTDVNYMLVASKSEGSLDPESSKSS